jgi:hypothetical protein
MVVESNRTPTAICSSYRPVLPQVPVVFRPQLVLRAIAVVISVERLPCVVGRVMGCKRLDDVEFYAGIAREAIECEIGVALGIVVGGVVDDAV